MKKDADAVYRVDHALLTILSPSAYKFSVHQVVTVFSIMRLQEMDRSGEYKAVFEGSFSGFQDSGMVIVELKVPI